MEASSPSSSPSPPPPLQPRRSQHQPPSPPPVPQRLRRQPKRQALQERSSAHTNQAIYSHSDDDDLFHTTTSVRAVLHHPADATPDFRDKLSLAQIPTASPPQRQQPRLISLRTAQGGSKGDPVKHSASHSPSPFLPHPGPSSGVPTSNTRDASSPTQPDLPVNALPTVLLTPPDVQPGNAAAAAIRYGLIATPPTSSSDPHPSSSPPWITYHHHDPSPRSILASSPPDSVVRQHFRWRDNESDDGDVSLPVPTSPHEQLLSGRRAPTPRGMQYPHSSRRYDTPPSSSSHQDFLDSIVSRLTPAAPTLLSSDNTFLTASSIGSNGTVRRNRRYTGHVPPGFFSLFPPRPSPRTPASSRTARSSSDPARPTRMYTVSPPSSGGSPASPRSPVSPMPPVSPLSAGQRSSWAGRGSVYLDDSRSQSETALHLRPQDARTMPNRYEGQNTLQPPSLFDQISRQAAAVPVTRRPVPRRSSDEWHGGRWEAQMSTILSEDGRSSTDPAISNVPVQGSRTPSGEMDLAQMVEQFPQSPTSTSWLDNSPTPPRETERITREGRESASYYKDLPPLPERSPRRPATVAGPSAVVHRDSQARQVHRKHMSSSSLKWFRESIQPWARSYYSDEPKNRRTLFGPPISPSSQAILDTQSSPVAATQMRPNSLRTSRDRQLELLARYRDSVGGRNSGSLPFSRYYRPYLIIPPTHPPDSSSSPSHPSSSDTSPQDARGRINPLGSHPPDPTTLHRIASRRQQSQAQHRRQNTSMPGDWSPHLWHDRRSVVARRRTFIPPSIDESVEGNKPSRRNLQIWLFALGFVFPPAWILAAFLPLPEGRPESQVAYGKSTFERDLEKALGPDDVARHENARWWRRINRCMVPVGLALIVAVVVLVVVAIRFEGARG